ncbi:hypothetical protein Q3G72_033082 [Acer saccharum]|nr:hypothetical protein Q3G72_033082 [Acer saccharum]
MAWVYSSNGIFSVKSFRHRLESTSEDYRDSSNLLWKGLCPPKVEIFVWQLQRGRISVKDVLVRRGLLQEALVEKAVDDVQFRVAWWFKWYGKGSKLPASMLLLNIKDSCTTVVSSKNSANGDGSSRGNPDSPA